MPATLRQPLPVDRLHSDPFGFGIVERARRAARGYAVARDLDLVRAGAEKLGLDDATVVLDVTEGDGAADGVSEHARGRASDELAVAPDRLIVVEHAVGVIERECGEAPFDAGVALALQCIAPDERSLLAEGNGKAEP